MADSIRTTRQETCDAIEDLFHWSENFEFPTPASLFLDLIGYSEETLGCRLCDDKAPTLGYLEHHKLGLALVCFADHPSTGWDTVERLLTVESAD